MSCAFPKSQALSSCPYRPRGPDDSPRSGAHTLLKVTALNTAGRPGSRAAGGRRACGVALRARLAAPGWKPRP